MPQHAQNPEHRWYFYPVEPPEDVLDWESWPQYQVCIPGPLISYLLNVMRVYQWPGRVKTDDPEEAAAFVQAWNDLVARVGASVESAECAPVPYPIFRMNPDNHCQTQQSLDGGATWTTILDTSACQPTIPPMIQFRQNPTQPYLLEQSHNSGTSWTTAFDYRKYKPSSSSSGDTTVYNIQNETINNETNIWNDNPTVNNYAPNMVYDPTPTPGNDQRDKAICYAIGAWYDVMKEAAISYVANQNDALAATGAAGVTAAVSVFGTPFAGFLAGAIVGALVKGISVFAAGLTAGRYDAARTDIICCMYDALQGDTLTQARFQASVSSCGFDPDTDSEDVRVLVNALVQEQAVYLSFLKAASTGFDYASFAELPDCLCGNCDEYDFTTGTHGFTALLEGYGVYHSGEGWGRGTDLNDGRCGLQAAIGDYTSVTFEFNILADNPTSFIQLIEYPYPPYVELGSIVDATGLTSVEIGQSGSSGLAFDLGTTFSSGHLHPLPAEWRLTKIIVCR